MEESLEFSIAVELSFLVAIFTFILYCLIIAWYILMCSGPF